MKMHISEFRSGQQHFLRGQFEQSIADFSSALKQGMDPGKVHVPLGLAHLKNGDFLEAVNDFDRALELDPSNDNIYFLRGLSQLNNDNPEKAANDFDDAIEQGTAPGRRGHGRSENGGDPGRC